MEAIAALPQAAAERADLRAPACPHCGYDLSGMVASWKNICPLFPRCTECGRDINIAVVLSPAAFVPSWSFEHASGLAPLAFVRTSWRCFAPGVFWREMLPMHPINLRRLALFGAIWLVLMHLLAAAAAYIAVSLNPAWQVGRLTGPEIPLLSYVTWPYRLVLVPNGMNSWAHASGGPVAMMTFWPLLLMPMLVFVFSRWMRAEERPRPGHLIRAFITMFPGAMLAYMLQFMAVMFIALAPDLPIQSFDTIIFAGFLFTLLFFPAWLACCWKHYLKHSLRAHRPDRAALAMWITATISGFVLMVVALIVT